MGIADTYFADLPKPARKRLIEKCPELDQVLFVNGEPEGQRGFRPDGAFGRYSRKNLFTKDPLRNNIGNA
jgi:hypothetical protein